MSPTANVPCKFHQTGQCYRGEHCSFAHAQEPSQAVREQSYHADALATMQSVTSCWQLQHNAQRNKQGNNKGEGQSDERHCGLWR